MLPISIEMGLDTELKINFCSSLPTYLIAVLCQSKVCDGCSNIMVMPVQNTAKSRKGKEMGQQDAHERAEKCMCVK